MNTNQFTRIHFIPRLCSVFEASFRPKPTEGRSLQEPHVNTVPSLAEAEGFEKEWPKTAMAITIELEDLRESKRRPLPGHRRYAPRPIHTLHLPLPVQKSTLEARIGVLQEASDLFEELALSGKRITFQTVSSLILAYPSMVYRHVPVGLFDSVTGEAIWIHPAAVPFDLSRCPFPASQQARAMGESILASPDTDPETGPLLDPATGLPVWAAMMRLGLEELGMPRPDLGVVAQAVGEGLFNRGVVDSVEQAREAAMAQIGRAMDLLFEASGREPVSSSDPGPADAA